MEQTRHEVKKLMDIVNMHFDLDILTKTHKKEYVDGRMVFTKILIDKGYGPSRISRILKKNHASILNYKKKMSYYLMADPELQQKYEDCLEAFYRDHDPAYDMSESDLRKELISLRRKFRYQVENNNKLRAKIKSLDPIFKIVKERTSLVDDDDISKKLIRMFNGVYR